MANLSSCDSDVFSEVPYSDSYPNDMLNQDVQEMTYSEQTHIVDFLDNEIHNDSNIIPYSQYLQKTKDAGIQDTNSSTPNDLLILSLVEQMTDQEIDTLKETLSTNVKEKESLSTTLNVFKTESKEKESKYIDKEIVLEKQNKEMENIICKLHRSTQVMHNLMKPQVFYDDTHKLALGYQNPFYLKKAQWIKPTLYDGSVIAKEHAVISVIDDEETLILEEKSRSKMLKKQNDSISKEKKVNIALIDYSKLNKIKEYFSKRFVTQNELDVEQAFWLKHSNHPSITPVVLHTPVKVEAPRLWGFRHTEACFVTEIIPFLKVLKDTFNAFDKTLLNEFTEVQTVFNQIEAVVDQCSEIMHIAMNSVDILDVNQPCVDECSECLKLETELFKKKDFIEKEGNFGENQNGPTFNQLFKINDLKAQSQEKDTVIRKLKDIIKSLMEKEGVENVKKDIDEIKTINIELEHNQFDSIKQTCVRSKEHSDSLIAQINAKSVEISDLNAQLQEKVFAIRALKNKLRKLKGKTVVDTAVSKSHATTIALGISKPSDNTKNNRISHTSSSNKINKVEDQSRSVKSRKNKKNHVNKPECNTGVMQYMLNANSVSEPISNALVKHSVSNAKIESLCAIYNKCLFDASHTMCLIDHLNDMNVRNKAKSNRNKKRKKWKPTGKVFTKIRYSWKPTGRNFTINGNRCPLTRITSTKIVPPQESTIAPVVTPTQEILVYSRRPKALRSVGSSSKVVQIVLWYLDSGCSKYMTENHSQLINFGSKFLGTIRFRNDHIAKIMGQFCDSDLEVAFCKHTCFVRGLEGVNLLKGSRGSNLYTLSLENLMLSSPICLLSKASNTKSWLWHRRLSHLNFDYINSLAKQGLVRGLPKLKYQKDHLCSTCALCKSKKHSYKPKAEDSIQEKLYLLHMDLCRPMGVQSINGRKYILVIVEDFFWFTWVKFLRSKDEVPEFVIKFLKMIQVRLNATVRNIRTDNGTEFVNQTLRAYYEEVGISHQTSVARTLQQNV
ncbi:retrovirus-related pol polyprotein from transposon TNT 1-94 [Tanacetum coccineum]